MKVRSSAVFSLVAGALCAQTTAYIAPSAASTVVEGNSNNTIPWWSMNATYQQVHDASDLARSFPAQVALIKGLSFRKDGGNASTVAARTLDMEITLGTTPVSAATVSTTFAANLGPSPMLVLPYTTFNLPAPVNAGTPNAQAWSFPFASPYVYVLAVGNLCYEMRIRNSTSNGSFACDAISGSSAAAGALLGTGCIATGQTAPATIGSRLFSIASGTYTNRLDKAAAGAPAAMLIGAAAQQVVLPGFCGALETMPALTFSGATDATGTWSNSIVLGDVAQYPSGQLFAQFVFLDAGLPNGIGLSNCSPTTVPAKAFTSASRIYAAPSGNTAAGPEVATSGSLGIYTSLVTGFEM